MAEIQLPPISNIMIQLSNFQLRMDFNTFVIAGPSTVTYSVNYEINGGFSYAAGVAVSYGTQCQTDTFSMTGIPGAVPPVICGTNSGYHGNCLLCVPVS